jgi:hypothetical protein
MMPKMIVDKLTAVMEALFADLNENVQSAARNCGNNDASTALHEMSHAIDMMNVPFIIREALEIPHDTVNTTPIVPHF